MNDLAAMLMGTQPVYWYDVARCTECGGLIHREHSQTHIDWHNKWANLAKALADWANKSKAATDA